MTYVVDLDAHICARGDRLGDLVRELRLLLDLGHRLVDLVDRPGPREQKARGQQPATEGRNDGRGRRTACRGCP